VQEKSETPQEKSKKMPQIYDKILKRILTLSSMAVVNLINGLFKTNFPPDSKLEYNWTEAINNELGKTIADTILTIYVGNEKHLFHIEVESSTDDTNDFSIVLRVFEYSYRHAVKHSQDGKDRITLDFPTPRIILLEHNRNSPDEVILELNFGTQGRFEYKVPTIKFLDYNIDELNAQHMGTLAPLYLLKLHQQIKKAIEQGKDRETMRQHAKALRDLINDGILNAINENKTAGYINSYDVYVLVGLVEQLYDYLYGEIQEFEDEGVKGMLAEKLFVRYEAEFDQKVEEAAEARAEARVEARVEARLEARVEARVQETILTVVRGLLENGIPAEIIATSMGLSIDTVNNAHLQKVPAK
jgi:hypothetical protein